jgi:hypothetical protein
MPATKTANKHPAKIADPRPAVAIGHVVHEVASVPEEADWLEALGVRPIVRQRDFAVMELRGGTHIVLTRAEGKIAPGAEAPFDFIVDDVDAMREACAAQGFKPGRMSRGRIHDRFELTDPSGYTVTILSSHSGNRPV